METTDLIEPGIIVAVIITVWRLLKADIKDGLDGVRRESSREHDGLRDDLHRFENTVNTRFNSIDERDRRRLRAMLE
jgi:hypothetical protein